MSDVQYSQLFCQCLTFHWRKQPFLEVYVKGWMYTNRLSLGADVMAHFEPVQEFSLYVDLLAYTFRIGIAFKS
jgi:hypothetical protein